MDEQRRIYPGGFMNPDPQTPGRSILKKPAETVRGYFTPVSRKAPLWVCWECAAATPDPHAHLRWHAGRTAAPQPSTFGSYITETLA